MAFIHVENVEVLNNPCSFLEDFQFRITFECVAPGIKGELEWKLVYVGSAEDEKYDQELDSVLVGPVAVGKNQFIFQAPAPDPNKIQKHELQDMTVVLLTCSYKESEFIRIGYYVSNSVTVDENTMTLAPPRVEIGPDGTAVEQKPELDVSKFTNRQVAERLTRFVVADQPRVTRFPIDWDSPNKDLMMPLEESNHSMEQTSVAAGGNAHAATGGAPGMLAVEEDMEDDLLGGEDEEEEEEEEDELAEMEDANA